MRIEIADDAVGNWPTRQALGLPGFFVMDFDKAIAAHTKWKKKLRESLGDPDSINIRDVARDDLCELGKWILESDRRYASVREFATLKSMHARFHQVTAELVERAAKDPSVSEEMIVGSNSEFTKASAAVIRALIDMKGRAARLSAMAAHHW